MSDLTVVACPTCVATIDRDAPLCPKCGRSMRTTPTMRRLETIIDPLLNFFWQFMGMALGHLVVYAILLIAAAAVLYFAVR
jgi:predicted amidophosphoribosyltransferase